MLLVVLRGPLIFFQAISEVTLITSNGPHHFAQMWIADDSTRGRVIPALCSDHIHLPVAVLQIANSHLKSSFSTEAL